MGVNLTKGKEEIFEKALRKTIGNTMMLGSKGLLPPTDAYELLRCEAALAILQTFEIR